MRNALIAVAAAVAAFLSGVSTAAAAAEVGVTPPRSERLEANGLKIAYQVHGPRAGRPMLLIAGTGMQYVEWPAALVLGLVKQGYRVILFDGRDSGETTHFTARGDPDWSAIFTALAAGQKPPLPYSADDMVQDASGLLHALHVESADVIGVSGGATIAALLAANDPTRVRSLVLIAANSGNPIHPLPAEPARLAGVLPPSTGDDEAAAAAKRTALARALSGPSDGFDENEATRVARLAASRAADHGGQGRQGAALIALGDIRPRLRAVAAPTLVLHGGADPLIAPPAGREVAEAIPGARFELIPGAGHTVSPAIVAHILSETGRCAEGCRRR